MNRVRPCHYVHNWRDFSPEGIVVNDLYFLKGFNLKEIVEEIQLYESCIEDVSQGPRRKSWIESDSSESTIVPPELGIFTIRKPIFLTIVDLLTSGSLFAFGYWLMDLTTAFATLFFYFLFRQQANRFAVYFIMREKSQRRVRNTLIRKAQRRRRQAHSVVA